MKYGIGDKIKIKTWEDMETQYGLREDIDSIDIEFGFVREMEYLCGNEYEISACDGAEGYLLEGDERAWIITDKMIDEKVTIYDYAVHCFGDAEFNRGGIPSKETFFLDKIGLEYTKDEDGTMHCSEDIGKFYDCVATLMQLNNKYK